MSITGGAVAIFLLSFSLNYSLATSCSAFHGLRFGVFSVTTDNDHLRTIFPNISHPLIELTL